MKRAVSVTVLVCGLAACQTTVPDSSPDFGVGVGEYQRYQQDAAARAAREAQLAGQAGAPDATGAPSAAELAAAGIGTPVAAGAAPLDPTGQVGARTVPRRTAQPFSGSNIVAYALATVHEPGQSIHARVLASDTRAGLACGRFTSPDLAQEAFLQAGGPQRDRRGMDPDGDGFVCGWDPRPYRRGVDTPIVPDVIPPEE